MLFAFAGAVTSCNDDNPFETITSSDDPRFLDPVFPDRQNGELATFASLNSGENFNLTVTVTPSTYTTVHWLLDGKEVKTGTSIDTLLLAGTYNLKIMATTTEGKSTSREGLVVVKPLTTDPTSTKAGSERIVSPGQTATLFGSNLDKVTALKIGNEVVNNVTFNAADGSLTYVVPASLGAGDYRISLLDADKKAYGADMLTVTTSPLITEAPQRTNSGAVITLKGVNLQDVSAVKVGSNTITTFSSHAASEITFTLPAMSEGTYDMSVQLQNGKAVDFYQASGNTASAQLIITSATTLWTGHHYVSWDLADGNANKTFNLLPQSTSSSMTPGGKLVVSYSLNTADAYHKIKLATGWWNPLPGASELEVTSDGTVELPVTQDVLNAISNEAGFLIVGHGIYIDSIILE